MRLCPKAVGALRMARDEGTPEKRAPWPRIGAGGLLRRPPALREVGNPAGHGLSLGDPEKEACGEHGDGNPGHQGQRPKQDPKHGADDAGQYVPEEDNEPAHKGNEESQYGKRQDDAKKHPEGPFQIIAPPAVTGVGGIETLCDAVAQAGGTAPDESGESLLPQDGRIERRRREDGIIALQLGDIVCAADKIAHDGLHRRLSTAGKAREG